MTRDDLEGRLSKSLKVQADRAEAYFLESNALARIRRPPRLSQGDRARRTLFLAAAVVVAAVGLGLWTGSLLPRSHLGIGPSMPPMTAVTPTPANERSPTVTPTHSVAVTRSPTPSGSAEDDVGPGTMVEISSGELVAYTDPNAQSAVVDRLAEGRVVWVSSDRESNGERWLRIQFASFAWDGADLFAWVSAESRLRSVELSCPDEAAVASLGAMSAQEHLNCFGASELTIVGYAAQRSAPGSPYTGTPEWIAQPSSVVLLGAESQQADTGLVALHADPATGVTIPTGTWVEVVGHFDDSAARTCHREPLGDGVSAETSAEQVHHCRQRFVVSEVRVVDAPTFPTPMPDAGRRIPMG